MSEEVLLMSSCCAISDCNFLYFKWAGCIAPQLQWAGCQDSHSLMATQCDLAQICNLLRTLPDRSSEVCADG